jgi:hypothetical protein
MKQSGAPFPTSLVLTVLASGFLGGGAVASGAWCSTISLWCLELYPTYVLTGSLFFGFPLVLLNAVLVVVLVYSAKVPLSALFSTVLILSNIAGGIMIGSTFLRGKGP